MKPTRLTSRLKCRHISHTQPYFIVRPLKLEEHSLVPYIAVFHDFMSDAETELFKSLAIENLERSAHGSKRSARQGVTSDKRTSKQYDILSLLCKKASVVLLLYSAPALKMISSWNVRSWVQDGSHHVIDKITKRISDSVGLNSQPSNVGSEHYQVDLSPSLSSHRISFRVCVYGLHVHWNFIICFVTGGQLRHRWKIYSALWSWRSFPI